MKKVFKLVAAGCLMFALTGCKKVSPEAQALMDVIKTAEQNEEPTYKEFSDIQNQYGALTEEVQKEVTNFPDYLNKANEYFEGKKTEINNALKGKKFYFSEKATSVGVINFTGDKIKISLFEFDGNGKHEISSVDYEYVCDGNSINLNSSSPMAIGYTSSDGKITLDSYYMTEDQILAGIQGNWTDKGTFMGMGHEWNLTISGNSAEYEQAAEARFEDGYYYYGPYKGTLVINDGSVEINDMHGDEFYFSCHNGKVHLYRYGTEMTPGNGLKGEDGYYNAF